MHSTNLLIINDPELKKRLRKTAVIYCIVLCISLAYLAFVLYTGIGVPCLFYEITGLKCVGCGISRMFISLIRLDFVSAFKHNPFVFITGPFIAAYLICGDIKYIIHGNRRIKKLEIFMWAEIVLAIAYGILRNIFPI